MFCSLTIISFPRGLPFAVTLFFPTYYYYALINLISEVCVCIYFFLFFFFFILTGEMNMRTSHVIPLLLLKE